MRLLAWLLLHAVRRLMPTTSSPQPLHQRLPASNPSSSPHCAPPPPPPLPHHSPPALLRPPERPALVTAHRSRTAAAAVAVGVLTVLTVVVTQGCSGSGRSRWKKPGNAYKHRWVCCTRLLACIHAYERIQQGMQLCRRRSTSTHRGWCRRCVFVLMP